MLPTTRRANTPAGSPAWRAACLLVLATAGLAVAGSAQAQAPDRDAMIQELVRQIQLRDAVIQDLQRRVGSLEQRVGAPPPAAVSVPVRPEEPAPAAVRVQAPPPQPPAPQPQTTAEAAPPADRPAAPGTVEVDEEAAERALDRTLTDVGALLLPAGRMEIAPSISYTRRETQSTANTFVTVGGDLVAVAQDVRVDRDEVRPTVDLRIGLPWDTQFEVGIPGAFVNQKAVAGAQDPLLVRTSESNSGIGFGDVTVGLAKTLLREDGWIPDAVLRVTYDTATGQQIQNGVIMPGTPGLHDIRASLSLTKRQDPLAFVAGFSYGHTFAGDFDFGGQVGKQELKPGDQYTLNVGAILAASPETSLQFAFQQSFQNSQKIAGVKIDDSNTSSGILSVGASMILGRGVLLSASAGVGLGRDAPDYFFALSVPVRFNTPF